MSIPNQQGNHKSMSTYRDIKVQIAKLEKQAADLYSKEVAAVAAKVRALVDEYGLTAEHLGLKGKAAKAKGVRKSATAVKPGVPKYRDPASGKTWTGKGKAPGWINEGLKQGKSKDDFLIGRKSPAKASTATKVAKAAKPPVKTKAVKAKPAKRGKVAAAVKKPAAKKPAAKKAVVAAKPAKAAVRKAAAVSGAAQASAT
jgi:DNA-binding protein H-NS